MSVFLAGLSVLRSKVGRDGEQDRGRLSPTAPQTRKEERKEPYRKPARRAMRSVHMKDGAASVCFLPVDTLFKITTDEARVTCKQCLQRLARMRR